MTEREQWRFQWPDGTWIRWNPHTQAWEKEEQDGAAGDVVSRSGPDDPPEQPSAEDEDSTVATAVSPRDLVGRPEANESYVPLPDPEPEEAPFAEEPYAEPPSEAEVPEAPRHVRARRTGVSDVIPPREPERPGGSLWPTIVAGAVLGIAVGLVIWSIIR